MKARECEHFTIILLGFTSWTSGYVNDIPVNRQMTIEHRCNELGKEPFFEPDIVSEKPWRILHTWNMKLDSRCLDIRLQLATPKIIRRFYYDMNEYLEQQPAWGAACLLMTMGQSQREMLLFDDQGPAGKLLGVPNTIRDGSISPVKTSVPLLKFQMKLIFNKKFLVIMDCQIGVVSLTARFDELPSRAEVERAARTLYPLLGKGHPACVSDGVV